MDKILKFRTERARRTHYDALVVSEKRYRSLIDNSSDAVAILDKTGKATYVSPPIIKVLGYSPEEIMEMDIFSIMHPDDLLPTKRILETVLANPGIPIKGHTSRMLHKDGGWRWIEAVVTNHLNDPAVNGIVDNFWDVSERKAADLQLYESELFNRSILSSLTSQIAVLDKAGKIIAVNKAWDDFAKSNDGIPLERTSTGSNYFEVCKKSISAGETDAAKALEGILSVFSNEVPVFELEYPCHSPNEKRWFILHAMHFGDDQTKVVISHQDITALKATQEKLLLSESRLNEAQAIAKIGSWEADLRTFQLQWSEETYHIFGVIPDNIAPTYRKFLGWIHLDDRKKVATAIRNSITENSFNCIEHRIVTVSGIEKIVEECWHIVRNEEGIPLRASGTCQEITQRKKTDELIIASQANLNAIIENTEAYIYSLDRNFNYITFNSRLLDSIKNLYGVDIHPGYHIFDFIRTFDPEGVREWYEIYSRALQGQIVKFEKEFFSQDSYTYTSFSIYPIWKQNAVIGLSCYVNDITDEKKANDRNKFQANLLDTIGQAVIATNVNGSVIFWNKAAEQIYGWSAIEALGKNIMDLTPAKESLAQSREIMAILKSGQIWAGELKLQRKDATFFPAYIANSPIYDQHQKFTGIIGISSDLTEKKALEERLARASGLARIGSYDADVISDVIYWSPMMRQIYEVENDFIPNIENALAFFKEGYSRAAITSAYHEAKENGTDFDLELQIVTAANHQRWIRIIGQTEFYEGKCSRIYGSLQDIDKIKIAELEVLKVYEEKNVILESIGDAFFAVDQNWTINYWNNMAEKVLGKTKFETCGKKLWEVFSEAVGSESYLKYQQAIDTNEPVHFEDYYAPLEKWYEVSAYPSINVLSVYFKDITQRKQTISALEESERNYSGLFHLSPLPMWVFDLETLRFLDVNEAALSGYGYSLSEFLSMTIKEIRPEEDLEKLNEVLATENAGGEKFVARGIFTHKKKDGKLIQVDIQSNLISYRGKPAKIVIASDMTERFNYVRAIEQQNSKLREIAWIQSHVVRAPLSRIMGIIPMIKDIDTYAEERETMLEYLLIAANELDDAIKNISDKTKSTG